MAISYVQSKLAYTGTTTSTLTTNSSVTSGNFLVVFATSSTLGTPTLSSSPSVTWTEFSTVTDATSPSFSSIRAWWGVPTSSGVMTLTITNPATDTGIHFWEINIGGGNIPLLDGTPLTKNRAADGPLGSYTLTTTRNNTFIISAISDEKSADSGTGTLAGADYSLANTVNASASALIIDAGAAGSETITWTWSVTNNVYAIVAAAFYLPNTATISWLRI